MKKNVISNEKIKTTKMDLKRAFYVESKQLDQKFSSIVKISEIEMKGKLKNSLPSILFINLDNYLDKGGFSQVFEAEDYYTKKKFAIKVIPFCDDYNIKSSERHEIEKEIKFLEELNDFGGSVNLIGFSKSDEKKVYYLLFDCFDTDLHKFLKKRFQEKKEIALETKISLMSQMIGILSYLQKKGILHRDLKAKNFLLNIPEKDSDLVLKICDFGIALNSKEIKESFTVAGTKMFLAPELINLMKNEKENNEKEVKIKVGNKDELGDLIEDETTITFSEEFTIKSSSSSFRSDVFSFGLNILFLLGYKIVNCNKDEKILNEVLKTISKTENLPQELMAVIRFSLAWDRDKRPDFIYLEDYFIYVLNCPLRFAFPLEWKNCVELYVSNLSFEEIKNVTDKDKIFKYFVDRGWKSTRMSTKFIEIMFLAANSKNSFPQELLEAFKSSYNYKSFEYYEKLIMENAQTENFITLCKIYSAENPPENGNDSVYKILNRNIGFDKIEEKISVTYLKNFLQNIPRSLDYCPEIMVLYRGLPTSKENHNLAFKLRSEYLPGTYFYWTAFVSASKSESVALNFLQKDDSDEGILFKILLSNKKRKYDIQKFAQFEGEAEVLLAPYFYYEIESNEPKLINKKNICFITVVETVDKNMPLKIIWVDEQIKNSENQEYCEEIRKLKFELEEILTKEEAIKYIDSKLNLESNFLVLSSGSIGKIFLPELEERKNVRAVGIFCGNREYHKDWARKELISKLIFLTSDPRELMNFLNLFISY